MDLIKSVPSFSHSATQDNKDSCSCIEELSANIPRKQQQRTNIFEHTPLSVAEDPAEDVTTRQHYDGRR